MGGGKLSVLARAEAEQVTVLTLQTHFLGYLSCISRSSSHRGLHR